MSYEHVISEVVKVVEAIGAGIMVIGGLGSFVVFASRAWRIEAVQASYDGLRRHLARCILLGLEVLIVGDIVRTIIVDPTIESVAVLGIIVVIRILLSFALEVEIDGVWPWRQWQLGRRGNAKAPDESSQWDAAPDPSTRVETLERLAGLRDRGAITNDEYQAEKTEVMNNGT
jgi:uncharacterized membrane protein